MAKVIYKYGIGAMAGTIDGMVHRMSHTRLGSIARKWVMPRLTSNNELFGNVGANLRLLWDEFSSGWKNDLKTYAQRWFSAHASEYEFDPVRSRYAFYCKLMYAWQRDDPTHIDLTTLNAEDLASLGTPIATVKAAVESGYLPMIDNYSDLTNVM